MAIQISNLRKTEKVQEKACKILSSISGHYDDDIHSGAREEERNFNLKTQYLLKVTGKSSGQMENTARD